MKLFYSEKQRQRDMQRAADKAVNEFLRSQYGRSLYGQYSKIGEDDNYLDYGYNANANLYSIISWIYNRASEIPFKIAIYNGTEKVDETKDHPVLELLECPNKYEGRKEFMQKVYGMYDVFGNSYIYAPRVEGTSMNGMFNEMYVMPSNDVEINAGTNFMEPIVGYTLDNDLAHKVMRFEDVLHMKYPNLDYENGQEWYGLSPLQVALNRLKADAEREELQANNYTNSGASGIATPKTLSGDRPLPEDLTGRMARDINNKVRDKNNRIAVTNFPFDYLQLGLTANDMQLIEDAKWSLKTLCNLYHMPSQLFNDADSSTYNNMREVRKAAIVNAVIPKVNSFTTEFNRMWISTFGDNIRLEADVSEIPELQVDKQEQVTWMKDAYWMKLSEKRKQMDLPEDPDLADTDYIVPAGNLPLAYIEGQNIMNELNGLG